MFTVEFINAPRFHPHKIPLSLHLCSTALPHPDAGRVLPGKGYLPTHFAMMRHDIDRKPGNALSTARVEAEAGIRATYYFRKYGSAFHPGIMKEIEGRGHEADIITRCWEVEKGEHRMQSRSSKKMLDAKVY